MVTDFEVDAEELVDDFFGAMRIIPFYFDFQW